MWLWCMIAAVGLAFNVACSDDDEDVTPEPSQSQPGDTQKPPVVVVVDTMEVLTSEIEVVAEGQEISFVTRTNVEYEVAADAEWITVTSTGRALTADYTVTATVAANEGEAREGNITVTFKDEANTAKTVVVKQAAYQAPEDSPVPPVAEYETVTVSLEIYPGAAAQEVIVPEDMAVALGVADLAAALADGTVTYAGLNADGSVYTAEDGTVPPFTTNGPYGHWYNSEYNPIVWATPDPNGTGAVRFAFLEGDGVTYSLGFDNSGAFVAGDSYAIAGLYTNGDTKIKFEVVFNVVEAPASEFVAPEADYTVNIDVVQDNAWGATHISLDGTDVTGAGAYADAKKYVTPVVDWSEDITSLIEAGLSIEDGSLEEYLAGGEVLMGAYNNMNEFQDCYSVHSSNTFFWFAAEGSAEPAYGGMACIDNLGTGSGAADLTGTTCLMPNQAVVGETYPTYIVFKTNNSDGYLDYDAEFVVLVNMTAVAVPEQIALPEFTVAGTYDKSFDVIYAADYAVCSDFSLESEWTDITTLIGATPDVFLISALDENLEPTFVDAFTGLGGTSPDGWFNANGAIGWGADALYCMKPQADGTFASHCCMPVDAPASATAVATFRYASTETQKCVDVTITVNITVE